MTALPDWMSHADGLNVADHDALSEEICRRIEVIDGAVVVNVAPSRRHQHIACRFAGALDAAIGERFAVAINVDLRLRDAPLLNRRPDIVVYDASLPDDAVLRPENCLLVVEVMSPGSITADQTHKPAEYAAVGIEHFWRIEQECTPTVFRYRINPTTQLYMCAGIDTETVAVTDPVKLTVVLADLY